MKILQKIKKNLKTLSLRLAVVMLLVVISLAVYFSGSKMVYAASSFGGTQLSTSTQVALEQNMKSKYFTHSGTTYHINQYLSLLHGNNGTTRVSVSWNSLNGKVTGTFQQTDPITSLIPVAVFDELKSATNVYWCMGEQWGVIIDPVSDNNGIKHFVVQLIEITTVNDTDLPTERYTLEIKPLFELDFVWISSSSGTVNLVAPGSIYSFGSGSGYQPVTFTRTGSIGLYALPTWYTYTIPYFDGYGIVYLPQMGFTFLQVKRNYINNFSFAGTLVNEQDANPGHNGYDANQDYGAFFIGSDMNFNAYSISDLTNPKKRIEGLPTAIEAVKTFLGIASMADPTPISGILLSTWDVIDLVKDIQVTTLPPERYYNYSTSTFEKYNYSTHSKQMENYGHLIKDCAILLGNENFALTPHGSETSYAKAMYRITQQKKPIDVNPDVWESRYWISRLSVGFNFDIRRYGSNSLLDTVKWEKNEILGNIVANYKEITPKITNNEFSYGLEQSFTLYNYYRSTNYYKIKLPNGYYRINLNQSLYSIKFNDVIPTYNSTSNTYYFDGNTEYLIELKGKNNNVSVGSFSIDLIEIGNYAFVNRTDLSRITIPSTTTKIGAYAFQNCSKLSSITIPQSVISIRGDEFEGCTNLTNVVREYNINANSDYYYYLTIPNIGNATVKIDGVVTTTINNYKPKYLSMGNHTIRVEAANVSQILSNPSIGQISTVVVGYPLNIASQIASNKNSFSFQNYGARFVNFALIATKNGTVYYPEGAIVIKDKNGNIIQKCNLGLTDTAKNTENSNNLSVYLPGNGMYCIEINFTDTDITSLSLSASLIESWTIDLFDTYENQNSDWLGFLGKPKGDEVRMLTLLQSGRFNIELLYSGADTSNAVFMIINETTKKVINKDNILSYNKIIDLEAGKYYIGYFNALSDENIDVGIYRQVTSYGSQNLIPDQDMYTPCGSEVSLNGGSYRGNTITEGFTRLLYLANGDSRLDYNWYSSDTDIATVSSYGTVLAKATIYVETTIKIMAVNKSDPSIVFVKEFIIKGETKTSSGELIEIGVYMNAKADLSTYIDLSDTIVPINTLQFYNWSSHDSDVSVDVLGKVSPSSAGIGKTYIIIGIYSFNPRVRIYVYVTVI